jgi:FkbM family methyltransferase
VTSGAADTGGSPADQSRITGLRRAFRNWWWPALLGSIAYHGRRVPGLRDRLMNTEMRLRTRRGPVLAARLRDLGGPVDVFGRAEYDLAGIDWPAARFVVDLGAHVGSFSLWAAGAAPCQVHAFEPSPVTFALLRRNLASDPERLHCSQVAVAGSSGARRLSLADDSAANSLDPAPEGVAGSQVTVDSITLAEALERSGFPRVDVLKLDIEGAEYEVFEQLAPRGLDGVRSIVLECHRRPDASPERLAERLRRDGFDVAVSGKSGELDLLVASRPAAPAGA